MILPKFGAILPVRKRSFLFSLIPAALCILISGCETQSPLVRLPHVAVQDTSHSFSTVVIDPGHGGKDSGVFKGGIAEKVAALDVAQRLDKKLRAEKFNTVMTRTGDYFVELNDRAAISNRQQNAIYVSIHFNDSRNRRISGIDTYYNSIYALPLAMRIERNLGKADATRGCHLADFRVLRMNKYPAVLVECGFLSNSRDASNAKSPAYRDKIATLIAQAIVAQRKD
jgi:N-acetylmuramoyl-L-alanine amidase